MPKCNFPQQTRDSIEILYHDKVLKHFPLYKKFWETFIGVRVEVAGVKLRPYRLNVPTALKPQENDLNDLHEKICMIHYASFCHLASALSELEELTNSEKIDEPQLRLFKHWQAFEAAYLHLGAAWQEIKILWEYIDIKFRTLSMRTSGNRAIWNFFDSNNVTKTKLEDMQKGIIEFRNSIAHFARVVHRNKDRGYEIPTNVGTNLSWTTASNATNWIRTNDKLSKDIVTIEECFDLTHKDLIIEFEKILTTHGIKVDYSSGQQDILCQDCGWWTAEKISVNSSTGYVNVSFDSSSSGSLNVSGLLNPSPSIGSTTVVPPANVEANSAPTQPAPNPVPSKKIRKCQNPKCGKEQ
jgi:hypothetical protein